MKHLVAALLLLYTVNSVAQTPDTITAGSNLVIDGMPGIPKEIANRVKRYSESRSAIFCTWHPTKRQMIISTRFGNVAQLHELQMPKGARKQLTFFDEPVSIASYDAANGNYFIFSRDVGGNEFSQLYRYDLKDGKVSLLTDGKRSQNGGVTWSHDNKRIAYWSTRRNGADRDVYVMNPLDSSSDKMVLQLSGGGWQVRDWSPDNKRLLIAEYISINESRLWELDIASGVKKKIVGDDGAPVAYSEAMYSKDGRGIYLVTDKDNEFMRLAHLDLVTNNLLFVTTSITWNVEEFTLSDDGKQLAFLTNEAGVSRLYLMNTANKKFTPMSDLPLGVYFSPAFHHNSKDLAVSVNTAQSPTDVYVINTTSRKIERWTESEMGGLVSSELSLPKLISWKSFDGKSITGFYYAPNARFTGKRPVMINIHGGPEAQSRPIFIGANNYYLNELGVGIIYPNVRGSDGYGKSFLLADNGMKREESVQDIGALLDWLATQPQFDTSRVMVLGGSYGGYMTLAVATHYNHRIRCALNVVGISHFATFLKNTESYRRDLRRVEYGDERDPAMAAFFEKIAPLNNASKISKPLFIVQGGNDPRVPRTEAIQMAEKVRQNNIPVWYLEAKDEGHGFRKKNNTDFFLWASVYFVQQFLLDGL